eukprot:CAMPEP_0170596312 /NCGR_PEP_ID=MMETSP0224-20130122/15043_1 /TAXON_ID=285029 /ORGANISM="Togula jolla, Strain CCCM 725" /LENGTH=510 /DNA_ID=CAMNT_0010920581 /DNA_START=51 /DNA_END=1583 /DNA_ORIENTATION=+
MSNFVAMSPAAGYFDLHLRPFFLQFPPCVATLARKRSFSEEEVSAVNSEKAGQQEKIFVGAIVSWERQDSSFSTASTTASTFSEAPSCGDLALSMEIDSAYPVESQRGSSKSSTSSECFKSRCDQKIYLEAEPICHTSSLASTACSSLSKTEVCDDATDWWQRQMSEDSQISLNSVMSTDADASTLSEFLSTVSSIDSLSEEAEVSTYLGEEKGKELMLAAKRMPNDWVCGSHAEFLEAYPDETECPWVDIGCVQFLNDIGFPYVCRLRGVYRDDSSTYVVSSFASEGDLLQWACKQPLAPGRAREAMIRPLLLQAATALKELHSLSIAHRDVSVENFLVDEEADGSLAVKLIDFGAASTEQFHTRRSGKPSYQAPEQHSGKAYDAYLADAFALGVVAYVALLKDYPWQSTIPGQCKCFGYIKKHGFRAFLAKRKLPGSGDRVAQALSQEAVELLEGLLAFDPAERMHLAGRQVDSMDSVDVSSISELSWMKKDFEQKGGPGWHGLAVRA